MEGKDEEEHQRNVDWEDRLDWHSNASYERASVHASVLSSSGKIPDWFKWALKDPHSLCRSLALDLETYLQ